MRHPSVRPSRIKPMPLRWQRSRSVLRTIFAGFCLVCMATAGQAQDEPQSSGTAEPSASGTLPGPTLTPQALDTIWVAGPDGKPVPIPAGISFERLRDLLLQKGAAADRPPSFYIGNLAATGTVNAELERALLKLVIDVRVLEKNRSVRVPLRQSEGTLLGQKYVGEGSVAFEPPAKSDELVCWFNGDGHHELTLELSVPVRKSPAGYRLLLSLPESIVNSLNLEIPKGQIQVRAASERTRHDTTSVNEKTSRVLAHRLGTAIDLTWQDIPDRNATRASLQTQTLIEAHVEADDVRLDVTQTIASQGSVREFFATIPAAFAVRKVSDENFPDLTWTMTEANRVRIDPGVVTGRLDLQWVLTSEVISPNPESAADEQPIIVAGPAVEGATRQEGLLGLTVAEGFSVETIQTRSIRRLGISSFRRLAGARLRDSSQSFRYAWQFESSASQIVLKRARIVPSFVIRPRYTLGLGESGRPEAVFTATYDLQVFRGKLDRIELSWPNFKAEGWGEPDITDSLNSVDVLLPGAGRQVDHLTLLFKKSISRSEAQSLTLECRRPISLNDFPLDGDSAFHLTLPVPIAQRQAGFQLTIQNGGSIESSLVPAAGTAVTVEPSPGESLLPPNTRPVTWQVNSRQLQFDAMVQSFDRKTVCRTSVTATIRDRSCLVEQTFDYQVLYQQLDEVRLLVPAGRTPQFWFQHPQDRIRRPLAPVLTGVETDDRLQFRLDLNPDMWGTFQVIAQYELPFLETPRPERISIPILVSSDAAVVNTHLEIQSPDNVRVAPDDSTAWEPELTISRRPGWVTDGELREAGLQLEYSQQRARQNFTIRRAMLESRFLPTARTQAAYIVDGDVSFLTIDFPDSVNLSRQIAAWWDGRRLSPDQFRSIAPGSREFEIKIDTLPRGTQHVLAIEFDTTRSTLGALNEFTVEAPQFAPDVWLAETQWNIVLPVGQHLAVYPRDYSPRFNWQRQSVFWERSPVPGQSSQSRWLLAELDENEFAAASYNPGSLLPFDWFGSQSSGNSYRFSEFGGQHQIQFKTMSQAAIVLCGAGFALAVSFILLRIPATRHVLTFLSFGFVLSTLALWQPEPVQLLVQPALFGMLLAVAAAILENRIQRSHQASLVTLTSPDDFLAESDEGEVPLHVEHPIQVEEAVGDDSAA